MAPGLVRSSPTIPVALAIAATAVCASYSSAQFYTPERPRPGVDLSVGAFNVGGAATGWLVGAFWHSDPTVSLSGQIGTDATAGHRAGWAGRFGWFRPTRDGELPAVYGCGYLISPPGRFALRPEFIALGSLHRSTMLITTSVSIEYKW